MKDLDIHGTTAASHLYKKVDFPGMHDQERILLLQRRHWSVLAQHITRLVLLAVLPLVIIAVSGYSNIKFQVDIDAPSGIASILGLSTFWLLVWLMFFHDWIDYYLDVLIVTNERIVRIEQKGLFNRTVADLTLDRVQDIAVETKGMVATFLRFGTLYIQSAAEREHFVFTSIPNPEIVKAQILTFLPQHSIQVPKNQQQDRTNENPKSDSRKLSM